MKYLFVLWALMVSAVGYSQESLDLTIEQLSEVCDDSLGEVEEYLTSNNWFFFEAKDEEEDRYGNAKFVYGVPNYNSSKPARYFITYHYSEAQNAEAVELIFRNKQLYDSLNVQIKNQEYKLIDSKTQNKKIIKVFKRKSQIIQVTIPPDFEGLNGYKFLFARKSSFRRLRG
ncbi:MAG: hypothetical protein AAFP76_07950 [Bacteroidota bacterium]